ncbi:MAG: hypothetical protein E7378_03245 [Clostridiales bacterium]|nr:hypothetical protein [Clostridiales bacterium]
MIYLSQRIFLIWWKKLKYKIEKNKIIICSKDEFCPEHILECGQVFSYEKKGNYFVYSQDKMAEIIENENYIEIITKYPQYFAEYFDLNCNYSQIKSNLINNYPQLKNAINYGYGIRILRQDIFETIISFIVSANNNIKRIKKILFAIREKFGKNMGSYFAFPTLQELSKATEQDFKDLGTGYRAKYLVEVCKQLKDVDLTQWQKLSTQELNNKLLKLMGVGQKVADCIMLFAFYKQDVFPVDTWIEKVYCQYFKDEHNRVVIRKELTNTFKNNSGYVQQYLFYSQRENN